MASEYPSENEMQERAARGDQVAQTTLSGRAKQIATGPLALTPAASPTVSKGRKMSAVLLRLARRRGVDPDEMVKEYPDDTVRRTKYPVVEEEMPDGTILYKHITVE